MITIEVEGSPAPQGSKSVVMMKGRPVMLEGKSKNGRAAHKAWRNQVHVECSTWKGRMGMVEGPLRVKIAFRLERPAAGAFRTFHATKPDLDKLARAVLDSMTSSGIIADDSRIAQLWLAKHYVDDDDVTGCTIQIESLAEQEAAARDVLKAEARDARSRSTNATKERA